MSARSGCRANEERASAIRLVPGRYWIRTAATPTEAQSLTIGAGVERVVHFARPARSLRTALLVTGATTLVAGAAGLLGDGVVYVLEHSVCIGPCYTSPETERNMGIVAAIAGATLLAGAIVTLVGSTVRDSGSFRVASARQRAAIHVGFGPSRDGAAFVAAGQF